MHPSVGLRVLIALFLAIDMTLAAALAASPFEGRDRGPHHRVVQRPGPSRMDPEAPTLAESGIIQLEPGLNRWEDGEWVQSYEEVEVRGGRVVARGTQHRVVWAGNANTPGAVDIELPDGARLRGHCLGLGYYDSASGRSALIAELRDSTAEVHAPNLVLYRNAFDDLDADLLYVNRLSSLEQYVVLHEPPPPPGDFNMDPATTRLEVISEFLDAPQPRKASRALRRETDSRRRARMASPDLVDETLDFGAMFMGQGQAFLPSGDGMRMQSATAIPMAKRWETIDGRNILFEAVEYRSLSPLLTTLGGRGATVAAHRAAVSNRLIPPPRQPANEATPVLTASAGPCIQGVVLDYTLINSGPNNFTFQGDRTYYISGPVTLGGSNTTFEAGAVIKFAPTNNARLDVASTNLTWLGTAYRPVILTARDDASVGESVTNSALAGYYAAVALNVQSPIASASIAHIRVAHAQTAIVLNQGTAHTLSHAQWVNCGVGLRLANAEARVRNALMSGVAMCFDLPGSTARVEHLTASQGALLNSGGTLLLTNSILAGIASTNAWSGTPNAVIPTAAGVFSSSAAGSHYLPPNSPHRDAGSGQIHPSLLKELRTLTTTAPTVLQGPVLTATSISPQVPRDIDALDLGYHYPPIDLIASNVAVQASLILSNGVVAALAGTSGFELKAGAGLTSEGTPTRLNRLVGASLVQEQPMSLGQPVALSVASSGAVPVARLRFTDISIRPGAAGLLIDATGGNFAELTLRDCCWRCGVYASLPGPVSPVILALTNNILDRVALTFAHTQKALNALYRIRMFNNLVRNASLTVIYNLGSTNPVWEIQDNLFDASTQSVSGDGLGSSLIADHNGFTTGTVNSLGGSGNRVAVARDFIAGPLGDFYYPTVGSGMNQLRNVGSRSDAALASLYHYTTTLDQTKEANTVVDIGFHYVAADAAGIPQDVDGDSAPDYLEDRNGNNQLDAGETSWTDSSHGLTGLAALQVFTPLK